MRSPDTETGGITGPRGLKWGVCPFAHQTRRWTGGYGNGWRRATGLCTKAPRQRVRDSAAGLPSTLFAHGRPIAIEDMQPSGRGQLCSLMHSHAGTEQENLADLGTFGRFVPSSCHLRCSRCLTSQPRGIRPCGPDAPPVIDPSPPLHVLPTDPFHCPSPFPFRSAQ